MINLVDNFTDLGREFDSGVEKGEIFKTADRNKFSIEYFEGLFYVDLISLNGCGFLMCFEKSKCTCRAGATTLGSSFRRDVGSCEVWKESECGVEDFPLFQVAVIIVATAKSRPIRAKITVDKNIDDVYTNARFLHAASSIVGCTVDIKTKTDDTYQGIFQAFSHLNDMFRTNEKHYNLSTCDNTLTPLERKNTTNTTKTKTALKIESSPNYIARIAVENGDEEEKFSAVVRPDNMGNTTTFHRYVSPAKRKSLNTISEDTGAI
uniref:LsmAD domain-containing protein n=1 Tax=Strigamia maritima TaxID=126957 RepID=T1ILG1_STRMM